MDQTLRLDRSTAVIEFAGLAVTLDQSGAAWIPAHQTLIVSDLHLEKGSNGATRGALIPPLDSYDTLMRLSRVIETYRPRRVICLGDSFHDERAGNRMAEKDRSTLAALCALAKEWVWISGNHDPEAPAFCAGTKGDEFCLAGVTLRHEPDAVRATHQIAGHIHPKAKLKHWLSGPCFCVADDLLLMPAFGTYTGGMDWTRKELRHLVGAEPKIFMLHASRIWRVA